MLALALSLVLYLFAAFGVVNSEWFGYRLLPGVLFMFLAGSLLYDAHHSTSLRRRRVFVGGMLAFAGGVAILLANAGTLGLPYNRETLLGVRQLVTRWRCPLHRVQTIARDGIRQSSRITSF